MSTPSERKTGKREAMKAKNETSERRSPRDRLLAAASELFYLEGVNSVGIDRIIERAGVAKASLYSHFANKDDLVHAYLDMRHEARKARIEAKLSDVGDPREKLLAVFDALGDVFAQPNYRGCAFVRASAEIRPDSDARAACDGYRHWIRALFIDLSRQADAADPAELGRRLLLLYDGASVSAQMDGDLNAASVARQIAEQILAAELGRRSGSGFEGGAAG
jgi:AcrR family transcriptional regulator